jgi:pyruvate,water dikinase
MKVLPSMAIAGLRSSARLPSVLLARRVLRSLEAAAEAIRLRPDVAGLSDERLVDEFQLWLRPECARLRDGLHAQIVPMVAYFLATRAFRRFPAAKRLLATGIPANPTTQISLGIGDLVEAARPLAHLFLADAGTAETLEALERETGGAEWLSRFRDFLARFGHRGPMEFDIGATRWSEDPSMLVDLVRAGLRSGDRETVRARMARLAGERQRAIDEAAAASPAWRRPAMRHLARAVERYMPLREAPKHYGIVVFARMRAAALELGRRLVERGLLEAADDVFFLELPELASHDGRDRRALVVERRARYERFRAERAPDFVRSDGVPVAEAAADSAAEDGVLRGAAISPGCAEGPVRVLREPDPRRMADGDVIVLEFADPGWTPLFPRAAAVVMEIGGLMCHAAVVAREMGIPAVFGVSDATHLLADGERVTVDGDCGTVIRSSPWTSD